MKAYRSQAWLRRRYLIDRKSPEEIAKECEVEPMTIYRYIKKYGFKR
jgi:DNA-binding MurR/RpiR family transcriptional regulator